MQQKALQISKYPLLHFLFIAQGTSARIYYIESETIRYENLC